MNSRQQRLLSTMRSLKYAGLVQGRNTTTWYVEGIYPIKVRVKLTCKDVHQLVCAGKLSSSDRSDGRRVLLN